LFPVLGFVNVYPFRFSFVADHFQYLASLGVITLVSAAAAQWINRQRPRRKTAAAAACVAVVAILAGLTWRQGALYADVETLWRTTLQKNPDSFLAHNNLGAILYRRNEVEAAKVHYQKAVELRPDFALAHANLGVSLLTTGRLLDAVAQFQKAVELDPRSAEYRNKLCFAFLQAGRIDDAAAE
jgi:Flp pilus assembly protein TadD